MVGRQCHWESPRRPCGGAHRDDGPEHDQHEAQDARKVAGTHARRRSECIVVADRDGEDAEPDEHEAGPEILGALMTMETIGS